MLLAEGEGRKDDATHRLSGRARDNRLVHVAPPPGPAPRPGDVVLAEVTHAAPHHLVADTVVGVRRTRAGDAWESRAQAAARVEQRDTGGQDGPGVLLGMPAVGAPVA